MKTGPPRVLQLRVKHPWRPETTACMVQQSSLIQEATLATTMLLLLWLDAIQEATRLNRSSLQSSPRMSPCAVEDLREKKERKGKEEDGEGDGRTF